MSAQTGIRQIRFFLGATVFFAVILLIILALSDKATIHIRINRFNAPIADTFFKYVTYLGDGVFVAAGVLVAGIVGFKKWGWSIFAYGWGLLMVSGALAQFLKRIVFSDALRPVAFLHNRSLHLVDGVDMHYHNSFPSGHTAAAFAFFGFLSLFCFRDKPLLQILCAFTAFVVGYSRMYLSQHFMEDVLAGMLLGTVCVILTAVLVKVLAKS